MELYKNEITIRRTGCSALDLAYIAAGRLDGFWGNGLKPWDVAAGIVIAEEAGALLLTLMETQSIMAARILFAVHQNVSSQYFRLLNQI